MFALKHRVYSSTNRVKHSVYNSHESKLGEGRYPYDQDAGSASVISGRMRQAGLIPGVCDMYGLLDKDGAQDIG